MKVSPRFNVFAWLWVLILLAGCSTAPQISPTPTLPLASATPTLPTATATPEISPTPTPLPGKVLLVTGASDPSTIDSWKKAVQDLASPSGWQVQSQAEMTAADVSDALSVVVFLSPPADLPALTGAAPQAQFVLLSSADVQAMDNLSVIRQRAEYQAFTAGFIVELLSTDWRGAGLLPSDSALGNGLQDAFVNGGHYFCGVCAPGWPLREYYPQVSAQLAAADGATWQSGIASLFDQKKIDAIYLSPEAQRSEVIQAIAGKDQAGTPLRVVGTGEVPAELKSQWAVSVRFDALSPLTKLWPDLVAGKGAQQLDAPLKLDQINPATLGEGKQRLVNDMLTDLLAGKINPFSVP